MLKMIAAKLIQHLVEQHAQNNFTYVSYIHEQMHTQSGGNLGAETCRSFLKRMDDLYYILRICWWI